MIRLRRAGTSCHTLITCLLAQLLWGDSMSAVYKPLIGKGRTAEIYDAGKARVLKLFKPSIPFETVQSEMLKTHAACMSGLPVADSYGMVRSGDRYGFLIFLPCIHIMYFFLHSARKKNIWQRII